MVAWHRFFFVKANQELGAVNKFIQTRFASLFSNHANDKQQPIKGSFIESIREASEQRFLQHSKIANTNNLKLKELYQLSLYEYYLLVEDNIISSNRNSPVLDLD